MAYKTTVPNMTSDTLPEGVCSASSIYDVPYSAFKAFDGDSTTFWNSTENSVVEKWLAYEFEIISDVSQVILNSGSVTDLTAYMPKGFKILVSDNGISWNEVHEESDIVWSHNEEKIFDIPLTKAKIFKLEFTVLNANKYGDIGGLNFVHPTPPAYKDVDTSTGAIIATSTDGYTTSKAINGPQDTFAIVPIQESVGLPNIITSSSIATASYEDWFAFKPTERWAAEGDARPAWIAIELGEAIEASTFEISCAEATSEGIKDFVIQGSNDYTTWDDLHTVVGESAWSSGVREYANDNPGTSYLHYRLYITDGYHGTFTSVTQFIINYIEMKASDFTSVKDIVGKFEFANISESKITPIVERFNPVMTSDAMPTCESSASSTTEQYPWKAFDGINADSPWHTNLGLPQWIMLKYTDGTIESVFSYELSNQTYGNGIHRMPRDWTLEGSNDGTSWTTIDTRVDIIWSFANQTQLFECNGDTSTKFSHFRVHVTANGGDSYLIIEEISLHHIITDKDYDTLVTSEPIKDGDNLVIVKDDNSIHEIVASGVTSIYDEDFASAQINLTSPNIVSVSEFLNPHYSWKAFDKGKQVDRWISTDTTSSWIAIEFQEDHYFNGFRFQGGTKDDGSLDATRGLKDCDIEILIDGIWTYIHSFTDLYTHTTVGEFSPMNSFSQTLGKGIKLSNIKTQGSISYLGIDEIALSEMNGYSMDVTSITQGEIPSKAYRVDEGVEFNGSVAAESNNTYEFADTSSVLDKLGDGSCIALYTFDGHYNDESGNYNGVGSAGMTFISGKFNDAVLKDVHNDHLFVSGLPQMANWTFTLWVNFSNVNPQSFPGIIGPKNGGNESLRSSHNGNNKFLINDGGDYDTQIGSLQYEGEWTFLSFSSDGSYFQLVVNDFENKAIKLSSKVWDTTEIGFGNQFGNDQGFEGSMDQIRIFDKALSDSEISAIYNDGVGFGTTRTFEDTSISGSECVTKVNMSATGNKMTQLDFDIYKES